MIALTGRLAWAEEFWIGATDDETTDDDNTDFPVGDETADPDGKPEPDGLADTTGDCLGVGEVLVDTEAELTPADAEAETDPEWFDCLREAGLDETGAAETETGAAEAEAEAGAEDAVAETVTETGAVDAEAETVNEAYADATADCLGEACFDGAAETEADAGAAEAEADAGAAETEADTEARVAADGLDEPGFKNTGELDATWADATESEAVGGHGDEIKLETVTEPEGNDEHESKCWPDVKTDTDDSFDEFKYFL